MGCWNGTCGISNLPIRNGQRVAVVLLVKQNRFDSWCYPSAVYDVAPLLFWGTYNDYGAAEDNTGYGLPLLLEGLCKNLIEIPQGENPYHDIPVLREKFDVELLWEAVHEGRLFIEGYGNKYQVEAVMIHGDIYDALMRDFRISSYNSEIGSFDISIDDIRATILQYIELLRESAKSPIFQYTTELVDWANQKKCLAASFLSFRRNEGSHFRIIDPVDAIHGLIEKDDWKGLEEFLNEALNVVWLNAVMSYARKIWSPQSGAGSQNSSSRVYRVLSQATLAVLNAQKAKYIAENDEDYEED